jgi:hypothetical protein
MTDIDSHESIAQLSQSVEKTLTQNRNLFEDMARFTRDESLRLAHAQLDHANHAFSLFRERQDFSGLIGAQQEWVKQMMQEYAALSLRYAEMFHSLAQHVQSHVESAAHDLQHQADDMAEDLGRTQKDLIRPHGGIHVEHPHMPAE